MSRILSITAGWTERLGPFTLRSQATVDDPALPVDLTGMTVTLSLYNLQTQTVVTPGGTVTVNADQINHKGEVVYDPVSADFAFSNVNPFTFEQIYKIRWKVVDVATKIAFFPNGDADEIAVYRS